MGTFRPSFSATWLNCPGSMAFPENQVDGGSSKYADDGSASHEWAALCLKRNVDPDRYIGQTLVLNGETYTLDEARAGFIQVYLDDVRRRATGGTLFVEHEVDLSLVLGEGEGGTTDAGIYDPKQKLLTIEDLKYGTGEKVYASYPTSHSDIRSPNSQLALYALGLLPDIEMLGEVDHVRLVVCQPRLGHIDEFKMSRALLLYFASKAEMAVTLAREAMALQDKGRLEGYLLAGEKQCRWCRAVSCPAREKRIAAEVAADFAEIQSMGRAPETPKGDDALRRAYSILPFIQDWINAVRVEVDARVRGGTFIGEDGQPMKYVEGKPGPRKWANPAEAEATLMCQIGEATYQPRKVITAPQAAKILDKKATKQLWKDIFEPMIVKAPGKPLLALGSDPRPPFTGAADANDFDEIGADE